MSASCGGNVDPWATSGERVSVPPPIPGAKLNLLPVLTVNGSGRPPPTPLTPTPLFDPIFPGASCDCPCFSSELIFLLVARERRDMTILPDLRVTSGEGRAGGKGGTASWCVCMCAEAGRRTRRESGSPPSEGLYFDSMVVDDLNSRAEEGCWADCKRGVCDG